MEVIRECLEICLELDDKWMIVIVYYFMVFIYEMIGENEMSKNYLEKVILIFEEMGD